MRKRFIRAFGLLLLGMLCLGIAWPYVFASTERIVIDETVRAEQFAGENFVKLSDGYTRFAWAGPEDGRVVVFVHGFSSPSFIWERQAEALASAGFRVLRYDLFGRGHSDRPDSDYDAELYHRQLVELLDSQGVTGPIDIVGLSMGGPITLRFVDREPDRVRSFGLIAPAGYGANVPAVANILRVPLLSNWILQAFGDRIILGSIGKAMNGEQDANALRAVYADQLRYHGYKRAIHRTLLNHQLLGLNDLFERVGRLEKPSILFWGDNDLVVPYENAEQVQKAIPSIEFHTIPGGSHTPNFESPDQVNGPLIAFLKAH